MVLCEAPSYILRRLQSRHLRWRPDGIEPNFQISSLCANSAGSVVLRRTGPTRARIRSRLGEADRALRLIFEIFSDLLFPFRQTQIAGDPDNRWRKTRDRNLSRRQLSGRGSSDFHREARASVPRSLLHPKLQAE